MELNVYRHQVKTRTAKRYLLIAFLIVISILVFSKILERKVEKPVYRQMLAAARKTYLAVQVIGELCRIENIEIDPALDPNNTGLIGTEFSPITTTLGNLTAKQTALNPDFAALIVDIFWSQGIKSGDKVAIQASASFPALTFAAIIACETVEVEPVISASLGSSSFGANRPELTYLDMENALINQGIIQSRSALITPGGENDNGSSFFNGGYDIVKAAAQRNGYTLFAPRDLDEAIQTKWHLFDRGNGIRMFVNIGGNQTSLEDERVPSGLIIPVSSKMISGRRLIALFLNQNIPVLNMLNIRELAFRNHIKLAPCPLPEAGHSMVYFKKYLPPGFWLSGLLLMAACFIMLTLKRRS